MELKVRDLAYSFSLRGLVGSAGKNCNGLLVLLLRGGTFPMTNLLQLVYCDEAKRKKERAPEGSLQERLASETERQRACPGRRRRR